MSYPGSQQQFGLSDLQLLQQQLMCARLQELQKQQQIGQLGDGKSSSSLNNMSMYAKHNVGGQIPNLASGTPFNASNMVASNNVNWIHHNVSSSIQGLPRGSTYSHGEGLMMSPALQQPDISFYGTPVASGQSNLGHYSPMQEAPSSSVYMLSVNSNEKPTSQVPTVVDPFLGDKLSVPPSQGHSINRSFRLRQGLQDKGLVGQASGQMFNSGISSRHSPLVKQNTLSQEYNRTGGQPSVSRLLHEQTKQSDDFRGTTTLDPLEEKILFDTEESGWDTSFSKLAAIDAEEFVGASSDKEYMNAFSSIQSGSWSALMQSAVAEASSSDTGVQEELSGLSFQNTDSSIGKQMSNLVTNEQQHDTWTDSKLQSSSNILGDPPSSVDSMLINRPVSAGHLVNDWVVPNNKIFRDLSQGSRTSALSMPGMVKNDFEFIQQAVDSHKYMPLKDNTDQKDYKGMGYDLQSSSNPMAVDALYKRAAARYGNQNRYRGENSCDSFNSKVSQANAAQVDHACLNAEDSESSARSSHKSQNQALCISSPGASQQECFSHFKPTDAFLTKTDSMIMGKPNLSADAFSKGSPASDMSTSFDSQNTSEHNKSSQSRDHITMQTNITQTESQELDMPKISVSQGAAILDRFSFQSSVPKDSRLISLGNGQKGQTWWTPSSFGHSSSLQGASLSESCSSKSSIFGKTPNEISNLKNERNSLEDLFSGHLHVNKQLDEKHADKVSNTSDSMHRIFPKTSQQISLSGFSPTQDNYPLMNVSSFGPEYTASGALPVTQSAVIEGTCHQGVKPLNVWKDVPSQKDMIGLSSVIGLPLRTSAIGKDSHDERKVPKFEAVDLLKGHETAEKYLKISTNASAYAESSINQQGYVSSGLVQRSSSGTNLRSLPTYSHSQLLHNIGNIKQQEDIGVTDLNKVDYNSSALYNLDKQQQPLHRINELSKNIVGSRFDSCSSGNNIIPALLSGGSSSMMEMSSRSSPLQYIYPHKVPVFAQGYSNGNKILSDRMRHLQIVAQTEPAGYMQNEYMKSRQMLSPYDSAVHTSKKASEIVHLSGNISHFEGMDASRRCGNLSGLGNQMVTSEQSLPVLPPDAKVNLVPSRTKKRKTAMYDCLPWHKEVMKSCRVLPDISSAEQEWAEVTNRIVEKHVDEGGRNEEMQPSVRAKRRLILTTKFMQLVFRPPPPTVLSVDASTDYEIVAYSVTKLALADACSLANQRRSDCNMPRKIGNLNRNGRMADHLSDKATELFQRTKELETPIDRLSKGISVVDVLVECQELEKLCVINHFARYHRRVPDPGAADSVSSSTGVASIRPFLQRYVSAVPLPLKLPDGVQCVSL